MNEEELKEMYKGLKRNKKIIGSMDTDFFFEFAETVLNLLEKKDTLIDTMQSEFERLEDLEDNTDMLKMELEKKDIDIIEAKEANRQLSIELQKKDRMTNEMAYYLSDFDIDEMCEKCERCIGNGCYADDDMEFKINCIKQYFENKVTDTNVGERKVENGN